MCCVNIIAECQTKGMTFAEVAKSGNTLQHLDSTYSSGVHVDTSKAALPRTMYDSVQYAYTSLLKKLGKFLFAKGFTWGHPTKCFNKIYFSTTGEIELFLFQFTPGQITPNKYRQFQTLLNEFIPQNKFPLPSP